jgi:myo-inositol-1(or 4)-monophosphatase
MTPETLVTVAIWAARHAAQAVAQTSPQARTITEKGRLDIFTDGDLAADAAIHTVLRQATPALPILSEESEQGRHWETWNTPTTLYWLVDPIDGTTNFARHSPTWTITLAAAQGTEVVAGVVYDAPRDMMFSAYLGGGAQLNGQPIRVADSPPEWAMCALDYPLKTEPRQRLMQMTQALMPHIRSLRCFGSSALALAHVAAGFIDSYTNLTLKPWDVAAGALLVREAGGIVTGVQGEGWHLGRGDVLAASARLHSTILSWINKT